MSVATMTEQAKSLKTERDNWNTLQNEGATDGYNPYDDKLADILTQIAKAKTEEEWTKETTEARRAEWNAIMKQRTEKMTHHDIKAIEKQVGYTMTALKNAVKNHAL